MFEHRLPVSEINGLNVAAADFFQGQDKFGLVRIPGTVNNQGRVARKDRFFFFTVQANRILAVSGSMNDFKDAIARFDGVAVFQRIINMFKILGKRVHRWLKMGANHG